MSSSCRGTRIGVDPLPEEVEAVGDQAKLWTAGVRVDAAE